MKEPSQTCPNFIPSIQLAAGKGDESQQQQQQEQEQQLLKDILDQLSDHETEVAAKASYDYFRSPDPIKRRYYAKLYAKRFLEIQEGDMEKTVSSLKDTLQFRTKMDIDQLRKLFDWNKKKHSQPRGGGTTKTTTTTTASGIDSSLSNSAKQLEHQVRYRNVYVQGYDKQGRSTYVFIPRNVQSHHDEWTIKQHVYTLERAVASSRAPDQTVNAVVDLKGFHPQQQAPPLHIGREFMATFGNHYATAIHRVFLIDAPSSFLIFWAFLKPLVGKRIRNKIHFVQSTRGTELSKHYDCDQAAPWMMRGGKKKRELDVEEYLYKTPFFQAFDE